MLFEQTLWWWSWSTIQANVQYLKKFYIIVTLVRQSLPVGSYGKGHKYTLYAFNPLIMTNGFLFGTSIWAETPKKEVSEYT